MKNAILVAVVSLAALAGCGIENYASNVARGALPRPASVVRGKISWDPALGAARITGLDADGNEIAPFGVKIENGGYELRLPSASYTMFRVQAHVGDIAVRAIVPFVGEESTVDGVDLDVRNAVETLIVEANLSARGKTFRQLTAEAYAGNGTTTGTRPLIRTALDTAGSVPNTLLQMAERIFAKGHPEVSGDAAFFHVPELTPAWVTTLPAVPSGWTRQYQVDYTGDGIVDDSAPFDQALAEAAQAYKPEGCPDPNSIRTVFAVDFNQGTVDGNCDVVNRFHWAVDKPGKQMFFVGWVHRDSPVQDPVVNALLGASVPNQLAMYDDGTHGDEVAGDGIWTISFALPRGVRVGYKYTWGTRGALWTGSEEWPGNSRIIEIDDVGPPATPPATTPGDAFVYRRDVFGDEATNKDASNLNRRGNGTVTWTTDVRGCGIPEAREQKVTLHNACACTGEWVTPQSIGPVTVACTQ